MSEYTLKSHSYLMLHLVPLQVRGSVGLTKINNKFVDKPIVWLATTGKERTSMGQTSLIHHDDINQCSGAHKESLSQLCRAAVVSTWSSPTHIYLPVYVLFILWLSFGNHSHRFNFFKALALVPSFSLLRRRRLIQEIHTRKKTNEIRTPT